MGPIDVTVTPADHAWQNDVPGAADRTFQPEDCCGFWLVTPDEIVWAPGDSRLIPDPDALTGRVVNPDRIVVLAPGQPFDLRPLAA